MLPPSDHLLRLFAAVPPSSRVLDLGCGRGRHARPLSQLGFDLYGCDARPDALVALAADGLETHRLATFSGGRLPYADDAFDWVVAYRLDDCAAAFDSIEALTREIRRVLKPGGWVYLTLREGAFANGLSVSPVPHSLSAFMEAFGLSVAESPGAFEEAGRPRVRAVYRRVDADTPL